MRNISELMFYSLLILILQIKGTGKYLFHFLTVSVLLPLQILTTVLNYSLRRKGKQLLPWDYSRYLFPTNPIHTDASQEKHP